jgi:hypothetical protein
MWDKPETVAREKDRLLHDVREGAALAHGWLEAVFRKWDDLVEEERREIVAAALLGAKKVMAALEEMDGHPPHTIRLPHEALAEEFLRVAGELPGD